jgi:hypothetical protein
MWKILKILALKENRLVASMSSRREDQFSYVVSSDGCKDIYPENRQSNFKIMLRDPIEFAPDEEWEVGLLDFHYPVAWNNINADMVLMYITASGEVEQVTFPDWHVTKFSDLTKFIGQKLGDQYTVGVDPFGKFRMESKGVRCNVGLSNDLRVALGISDDEDTITVDSFMKRAEYNTIVKEFWKDQKNPVDFDEDLFQIDWPSTDDNEVMKILKDHLDFEKLNTVEKFNEVPLDNISSAPLKDFGLSTMQSQRNASLFLKYFKQLYAEDFPPKILLGEYVPRLSAVQQLHICSNIVKPVDMNDTTINLMKIVTVKGTPGTMSQEVFAHPVYQPVEKARKISMIHIYIKNEIGELVPFAHGQVLLTLHFRRQRTRH